MSVWAVAMVKDELDMIGSTIPRMLTQVDHVLVADNGSTDGTREWLYDYASSPEGGHRLKVIEDPEVGYYQSEKVSALAARAAAEDAAWIVPFDADEVWLARGGRRVADFLASLDGKAIIHAELYDHVGTAQDPDPTQERDPVRRMGWRRRSPLELPKVACRPTLPVTIGQGNHSAVYPVEIAGGLEVRHFSHRSPEQFVRKVRNGAAAYEATNLPDSVGAHWRQYGQILKSSGPEAVEGIFREFFWSADPESDPELVYDPCPS